jgi:hypothetical protein
MVYALPNQTLQSPSTSVATYAIQAVENGRILACEDLSERRGVAVQQHV